MKCILLPECKSWFVNAKIKKIKETGRKKEIIKDENEYFSKIGKL